MQESSGHKTETSQTQSDATSKETVADIEDNEKSSSAQPGGGLESSVPSPDGAFEDMGESKETGPM